MSSFQSTLHPSGRPELEDLFPKAFVETSTEFETWGEFAETAPWNLSTWEDLAEVPRSELSVFVRQATEFDGVASFFQATAESLVGGGE